MFCCALHSQVAKDDRFYWRGVCCYKKSSYFMSKCQSLSHGSPHMGAKMQSTVYLFISILMCLTVGGNALQHQYHHITVSIHLERLIYHILFLGHCFAASMFIRGQLYRSVSSTSKVTNLQSRLLIVRGGTHFPNTKNSHCGCLLYTSDAADE